MGLCTLYEYPARNSHEDRRYFIQKHNAEQEKIRAEREHEDGRNLYDGETINQYAALEQEKAKNMMGH